MDSPTQNKIDPKKQDQYDALQRDINYEYQTQNYEKAIVLCKKLLFFLSKKGI